MDRHIASKFASTIDRPTRSIPTNLLRLREARVHDAPLTALLVHAGATISEA
jgi:hypothetical protein